MHHRQYLGVLQFYEYCVYAQAAPNDQTCTSNNEEITHHF